jgi:hypothetical protein
MEMTVRELIKILIEKDMDYEIAVRVAFENIAISNVILTHDRERLIIFYLTQRMPIVE